METVGVFLGSKRWAEKRRLFVEDIAFFGSTASPQKRKTPRFLSFVVLEGAPGPNLSSVLNQGRRRKHVEKKERQRDVVIVSLNRVTVPNGHSLAVGAHDPVVLGHNAAPTVRVRRERQKDRPFVFNERDQARAVWQRWQASHPGLEGRSIRSVEGLA